jgi:DNA polymerase alpha subunit A
MEDPPADAAASGRSLRARGTKAAPHSAALERLRAIKAGGARAAAAVQVRMEDPIYDTVAEEDYAALVARRRKDAGAFIIDDDGLGYVDDGREEDWTHRALPSSSDEGSGDEDGAPRKRKQPRPPQAKRPPQQSAAAASLSAAAAMMGKQRLSSMFTSSVFKKPGSDRAPAADSIVDDVIAEFAPDENDREERRRRAGRISAPTPLPPPIAQINAVKAAVRAEMEVRSNNGFEPDVVYDHGDDMDVELMPEVELKPDVEMQPKLEATPGSGLADANKSLEELKQEADGEVKIEKVHRLNAKIKAEGSMNSDVSSATAGWMKICGDGENAVGAGEVAVDGHVDVDERSEFELKDGALPFYILDAYEEPFGVNSGTVYLFGKVNIILTEFIF